MCVCVCVCVCVCAQWDKKVELLTHSPAGAPAAAPHLNAEDVLTRESFLMKTARKNRDGARAETTIPDNQRPSVSALARWRWRRREREREEWGEG